MNKQPVAVIDFGSQYSHLICRRIRDFSVYAELVPYDISLEELKKLNNILYRKINYDGVTLIATTQNKDLFNRLASVTITLENGRITSLRSFSKKKDNYRNKRRK